MTSGQVQLSLLSKSVRRTWKTVSVTIFLYFNFKQNPFLQTIFAFFGFHLEKKNEKRNEKKIGKLIYKGFFTLLVKMFVLGQKCCYVCLDQKFDPSLLINKLWLVFIGKKKKRMFWKKKSKWPTQKNNVFQNCHF